ncbi:MAG: radical SAM protein [Candidatus Lokiarchaeota archaeon]|nr:radical SAM protein [Candidatus Lokiarchaeota archaeon]
MTECKFCGKKDKLISKTLQVCRDCILEGNWDEIKIHLHSVHTSVREMEKLPEQPPSIHDDKMAFQCDFCINECFLSEDQTSYCGLRNLIKAKENELPLPTKSKGYIHGYLDANPTNCCNAWFCPAGTSNGYPVFSDYDGPEYGTYSYAAFLYGCSFDCLFCQNASHKCISKSKLMSVEDIVNRLIDNEKITCVCFFGGSPEPQLPFTINIAEKTLEKMEEIPKRKIRFCWEWNGSGKTDLVEKCMKIAVDTGGNIKFDLKTYHEKLNIALCGISNNRTLANFKYLAENYFGTRPRVPEMSGCTLLVPGYTTPNDVELIAKFISKINTKIPYSLLVFHPDYQMYDLPITSKKEAYKSLEVAKSYLENVHLGNQFLL